MIELESISTTLRLVSETVGSFTAVKFFIAFPFGCVPFSGN